MESRIPHYLKGKGRANEYSPPPRKRIRAPDLDNSDLIRENALTLKGRLTNPKVQRLWSLIPFISNKWNLKGKAIGSDLGNGCFQFRFDFEEDLQKVLDNRPYHLDQWMVILQRWEPIISSSFPAMIPFWIDIQGLPKHYWKPKMLINIAEEIGELMVHEITATHARIKVLLDGLKPLLKDTIVEFPDVKDVLVTLDYKNLKNHCLHGLRLSHDMKDCPGLKSSTDLQKRTPPRTYKDEAPRSYPRKNYHQNHSVSHSASEHLRRHQSSKVQQDRYNPSKRQQYENGYRSKTYYESRSHELRKSIQRRSPARASESFRNNSSREQVHHSPSRGWQSRDHHSQSYQRREKQTGHSSARPGNSESSRTRLPPLERIVEQPIFASVQANPYPTIPTTEETMGELREVTVQYLTCAEPTESAARKQRVMQEESRGLMAETAANIIAAATAFSGQTSTPTPNLPSEEAEPLMEPQSTANPSVPIPGAPAKKRGCPPINRKINKSPWACCC
ncbi:hypothetical protein ISN44_As10g010140 [Arabidopsis suecica]|uniref:DUF4283 domain-containing protein n=1 Tax=Arabidopsis suecica TaxID=45249 RepID=A0A8T1ZVE5_ARASU|nr:hypothetical protein ISN44_As10g010140 [Arabidopsis suecica]